LRIFDPSRARPCLLQAGDAVQFVPIGRDEWDRYTS
jgi:allophanate hydrolase subunit 1